MSRHKWQLGFTLIELMIVVTIIGILSTIAVPAYEGYIKKSELTSAQATLRSLIAPAEIWYLEHAQFSESNLLEKLGSSQDANPLGTIQLNEQGVLSFTFSNQSRFPSDSKLSYIRTQKGWQCFVNNSELVIKGCAIQ